MASPVEIGRATTVVPAATFEIPGEVRPLQPGAYVFQDGLVRTQQIGAAGITFLDETTLTVYPNSEVKLDRFIFDPARSASEVAVEIAKGAMRFASGGRRSEAYRFNSPHVTLGIRGTVIHVVTYPDSTIVQALHGAFYGCSRNSDECRLVQATDRLNAAQFWSDGRVTLLRASPNLGVRQAFSTGGAFLGARVDPVDIPLVTLNEAQRIEPVRQRTELLAREPLGLVAALPPTFPSVEDPRPAGPPCFLRGTRILTPCGERLIEQLTVGDRVATASPLGYQAVRWIPRSTYRRRAGEPWPFGVAPVRIARNAIADGVPHRDLLLSRYHAVLVDGHLVEAGALINGRSIRVATDTDLTLEYFNLEFENQETIWANGVPVESFAPAHARHRGECANFAEHQALYPGMDDRIIAPILPRHRYHGRRTALLSRFKSAISPMVDRRGPAELARDRIATRARKLAREGRRTGADQGSLNGGFPHEAAHALPTLPVPTVRTPVIPVLWH